ncbi:MAG: hypothetical protein ACK4RW_06245 [Rehaibacterium terrae]|uniref:hypothetical protein n=1 Tax=Rehaibacterium terrae TaxID=1341696 RepID=UPI00391908B9
MKIRNRNKTRSLVLSNILSALVVSGTLFSPDAYSSHSTTTTTLDRFDVWGWVNSYDVANRWYPQWDFLDAGYDTDNSSGGGGDFVALHDAPDRNDGQHPANCYSDSDARGTHAQWDFAAWRLENARFQTTGRGELIRVTYDDGSKETYRWRQGSIPSSTAPWFGFLDRIPYSLVCPSTAGNGYYYAGWDPGYGGGGQIP